MKTYLITFLFLVNSFIISGMTGNDKNYLTPQDTVLLDINFRGQKIFKHELAKGQTLYSLSKFYGLTLEKFYEYNPTARNSTPRVGNLYTVPIPNKAIIRMLKENHDKKEMAPICYVVKKGDTMYGVAKRHFRVDVETLMENNGLTTPHLKPGQQIHVGWMRVSGIDKEWQYPGGISGDLVSENKRNRADFLSKNYYRKTVEERGKVQWDNKDNFSDKGLYCLHNSAPYGSIIKMTNTFTNNTVYVKVVGKMPLNYDKWVVAAVSRDVAKALRAIDAQFFVVAEYYVKK